MVRFHPHPPILHYEDFVMNKQERKEYDQRYYQENKQKKIEYSKRYYQENKEKKKEYNQNYYQKTTKPQVQKKAEYFDNYKRERGCIITGENNPVVLDFHHKDPNEKEFNIADGISKNYGWKRLHKEVAKCVIIRADKHRLEHWNLKNDIPSLIPK